MKTVFIFIGPKGSGKSYIGQIMERHLKVPFLVVENIFLKFQKQGLGAQDLYQKSFHEVGRTIANRMENAHALCFETTGASPLFFRLLDDLRLHYAVKLIAVRASSKVCFGRIKNRDGSLHLPVNDSLIHEIHRISTGLALDYDLTIRNENLDDQAILKLLLSLKTERCEGNTVS